MEGCFLLAFFPRPAFLQYPGHQPRGTAHSEWCPPTSIIDALQACLQVNLVETLFQLRFLLPRRLYLGSSRHKISRQKIQIAYKLASLIQQLIPCLWITSLQSPRFSPGLRCGERIILNSLGQSATHFIIQDWKRQLQWFQGKPIEKHNLLPQIYWREKVRLGRWPGVIKSQRCLSVSYFFMFSRASGSDIIPPHP